MPDWLTFVDSPRALQPALAALADVDPVGVDVERADAGRYYRRPALIQLGGAERVVVVDPLAVTDLAPLAGFLTDRRVVLHAMENDLTPLAARAIPLKRVEDTSVAAMLLGLPTGLEALREEVLGVRGEGDKEAMQRADWEQRPLSEAMVAYAAHDVADLPRLWAELAARLSAAGRQDWYAEELLARQARAPAEDRRVWTQVRGAERLNAPARARLRAVWLARERCARDTDTAPGRVASDEVLLDLAEQPARSQSELRRRGMSARAVRRFGGRLLAALTEDAAAEEVTARAAVPSPAQRARADRLRALRADRAAALGLDPGVLCPRRALVGAVMVNPTTPDELRRALGLRAWQWRELADVFCDALGLGEAAPSARYAAPSSKEDPDG